MKRQKAVLLAEGQTPGRADEDTNLVRLTGVRPLGRSGWYNYYGCASIEDMAEQSPGLTFQGSGSADVDCLLNFLSITNYTDDLLGDSAE
jgi:hypothetical protein